jgi:hypothetical protein
MNSHVHPIFREFCQPDVFDIHDDALLHDVMGNKRLAKPVQSLLATLEAIEAGYIKADPTITESLVELRRAVYEQWREEQ